MTIPQKFQKITDWTQVHLLEEINQLKPVASGNVALLSKIEAEIGEQLPNAFKEIYKNYNGETDEGERGAFLGVEFMELGQILDQVKFSKTFIKPEKREVTHPRKSNQIIEKIIQIYTDAYPAEKQWEKIKLFCSPGSFNIPDWYDDEKEDTQNEFREKLSGVTSACKELHDLEKDDWNWDELEITAYADGRFSVERKETDWNELIRFSCLPEKTIQLKYFNYKWLPLFHDYAGNYIGLDLAPAENGTKGQIIIFGRDESLMVVLANDLSSFFDWVLSAVESHIELFKSENHLHEILKSVKGFPNELI